MWPKLLIQYLPQLIELLPHVSRVVPAADKYLAQRNASDAKLDTLATTLRTDLGKVARAHVDMAAQLDTFSAEVSGLSAGLKLAAEDAARARTAAESIQARLARTEDSLSLLRILAVVTFLLLIVAIVLLVILLARSH